MRRRLFTFGLLVAVAALAPLSCSFIIGTDARSPSGACDLGRPFETPVLEAELSAVAFVEESARLTPDELEAYVSRRTSKNLVSMFRYRRASRDAPWSFVFEEPELGRFSDGGITSATSMAFLPDASAAIVQYYDEPGSPAGSLSLTTRPAVDAAWSRPVAVPGLESDAEDNAPYLSQDGTALYFHSNRILGTWRIFRSTRTDAGWSYPTPFVLEPDEDRNPVLTGDELTLYFSGLAGGTRHVRRATRSSRSEAFGDSVAVDELNSFAGPSVPTWVSPDGCRILILAVRGQSSSVDVYSARKPFR